jgi:hypothetical protein
MKQKTLVAIIIATTCITLISCYWLFGNKPSAERNKSIVGKWTMVNMADSSKRAKNRLGGKDSTPLIVEFNPDSTFRIYQSKQSFQGSGEYYLDPTAQTLFVKEDSSSYTFNIRNFTDSSVQLFFPTDSLSYVLRKQ